MTINNVSNFLSYYQRIKQRTRNLFEYIPEEKLEWRYDVNKFSIGDIIRHIACIERYMYAETIMGNKSQYKGCGINYADGLEEVIRFYNEKYEESKTIFEKLDSTNLDQKCMTPAGTPITTWKWLRAMVEHEVHHRGQLYFYLGLLDIKTPPIYGLTSEEVIARSI